MARFPCSKAIQRAAEMMIALGVAATVVAPMVLAIEVGEWLSHREWPGWSIADGLGLFGIERNVAETPAQQLLDVLLAVPLTLVLFIGGIHLFLAGLHFADWGLERERRGMSVLGDD